MVVNIVTLLKIDYKIMVCGSAAAAAAVFPEMTTRRGLEKCWVILVFIYL